MSISDICPLYENCPYGYHPDVGIHVVVIISILYINNPNVRSMLKYIDIVIKAVHTKHMHTNICISVIYFLFV